MRPLFALENDITTLELACSEQQATELAQQAEAATRSLLAGSAALPEFLASLKAEAATRGWDAKWVTSDASSAGPTTSGPVIYLPVRGKLVPRAGMADPFASLLSLLERFSSSGKRIDLIRLAIRADEGHWTAVELNLRVLTLLPHEKTP